jgi:hypothetical protein
MHENLINLWYFSCVHYQHDIGVEIKRQSNSYKLRRKAHEVSSTETLDLVNNEFHFTNQDSTKTPTDSKIMTIKGFSMWRTLEQEVECQSLL